MGHVNAQITLKNAADVTFYEQGFMAKPDIRQTSVNALVDTGSTLLVINRELFEKLGLSVIEVRPASFANDGQSWCKITSGVEIHWEDRYAILSAALVDDAPDVLLGVVPLEVMDLIVDPKNQTLVGAHGDQIMYRL